MAWLDFVRQSLIFRLLVAFVATIVIIMAYTNGIPRHFSHHLLPAFVEIKNVSGTTDRSKNVSKKILFYTSWFNTIPWPLHSPLKLPCPHKCLITYDKSELAFSDAIVFHDSDIKDDPQSLKRMGESLRRRPQQRWVYYTHENPHNVHDPAPYNGIFNWTITYRSDSDIPRPYGNYNILKHGERIPNENITTNYAKEKDKLIAWAISHCGTIRDKVVKKLIEFVPVTVIGGCSGLFNQVSPKVCRRGSPNCPSYLKRFKFYLAFENGMCTDYITEKYWNTPFDNNMVPIVLGSNYGSNVAIPGSYINILDFPNMKAFSDYIKYLDKNDTAYNEYFSWKAKFKLDRTAEDRWLCRLCVNLYNDSLPKKIYTNFEAYWGVKSNCYRNKEKIHRMLH